MMRIARYLGEDGEILEGVVQGDEVEEISGLDTMLQGGRRLGVRRKLADVQLLPWGLARKIVGVGKNFDHARGQRGPHEPLLIKPTSALTGMATRSCQSRSRARCTNNTKRAAVAGKRLRRAPGIARRRWPASPAPTT
jgi:hypothetical protein